MSTPLFTVTVHELDSGPRIVKGPLPADFLTRLLADTDVEPYGDQPAEVALTVENTDPQILVRGYLDVTVAVPCARTLDPAVYRLRPDVFLLLSPAGELAKTAGPQRRARPERSPEKLAKVAEKRAAAGKKDSPRGSGPSAKPKAAWDDDPELGEQDAAHDTYAGDQIVLDGFIREFILLEIPMVPLREDLRSQAFEASPPPPSADPAEDKPLDPRLSPLAELKARLEQKKE